MRLHRFFLKDLEVSQNNISVSSTDLIHQWRSVFRLQVGDNVILFNGSGKDLLCRIEIMARDGVKLTRVSEEERNTKPSKELTLFFSVIKKDKNEWILQKGTEIGVSHFVPVISERSEKKNLDLVRAEKIIIEAVEQSGRSDIPSLASPISLEEALTSQKIPTIILDAEGKKFEIPKERSFGIFIGPEGGWGEKDKKLFSENNVTFASIGKLTLRAETAAIAAVALTLLL
ncbi:MAG: RsmE family RNA methyltransferase [Patescibacteria group bacterium]